MKSRGITFAAWKAQAIHASPAGQEWQTRRELKPKPRYAPADCWATYYGGGKQHLTPTVPEYYAMQQREVAAFAPLGQPGDLLYIREPWRTRVMWDGRKPSEIVPAAAGSVGIEYLGANDPPPLQLKGRYRHARFMCRWMARTWLRITTVRVERVQDITPADCWAEGIAHYDEHNPRMDDAMGRVDFATLWEEIHGVGAWDRNDWVWVYSFEKTARPEVAAA